VNSSELLRAHMRSAPANMGKRDSYLPLYTSSKAN
jgi:hypothetical protein